MGETVKIKPSPKMKTIYTIYLTLAITLGILSWGIPLTLVAPQLSLIIVYIPALLTAAFTIFWTQKYYETVEFELNENYVYCKRGVWWKRESRIPYYRVNDVILRQGPLQRILGLANVDFHTAALGGQARPEVTFFQLEAEKAEEVRNEALKRIGILTGEQRRAVEEQILEELRKIRKLLEKQRESS